MVGLRKITQQCYTSLILSIHLIQLNRHLFKDNDFAIPTLWCERTTPPPQTPQEEIQIVISKEHIGDDVLLASIQKNIQQML